MIDLVSGIKAQRDRYNKGIISSEEMAQYAKRAGSLRKKFEQHKDYKEDRQKYLTRTERHLSIVRAAQDATFVAFDCGFHPITEELHEVGIVVHSRLYGNPLGYNICIEGKERREINGFPTITMSKERALVMAQEFYNIAHFAVFHSATKDIELLGLDTSSARFFDTSALARQWYRDTPSLEKLCVRYNLDTANLHTSVIDALRTIEVLWAISRDTERPIYFY